MAYVCKCFKCDESSSEDSDMEDEIPHPPGVIPLSNDAKTEEMTQVQTPSASQEYLLKRSLKEKIRDRPQITIRKQLFSMTGYNLVIFKNGKVKGTREHYSPYAMLDFRAVARGEVQIRGVESSLYLALNRKGRLYGEADEGKENTVWIETLSGAFFNYLSKKYAHSGWYVGIKKSGKPKRATKTDYGQRAVQFLPRHPHPVESHFR